jgi:raffinose/stachyose/melibiose transport system permease protein
MAVLLLAVILPHEALIYPLFWGVQLMGLSNSLIPIIVIFTVLNSAFGTYLLASVMGTIPKDLIESAQTDGASRSRILWSVLVPLLRPAMAVLFVLVFVWSWNDFFIPISLLISSDVQTIPIALSTLQNDRFLNPVATAAASLISLIPTIAFFLVFQRTLVRGVTMGAIR